MRSCSLAVLRQSRIRLQASSAVQPKLRMMASQTLSTLSYAVADATFGNLGPRINSMANGTALHEDDGMVTVLAGDSRG